MSQLDSSWKTDMCPSVSRATSIAPSEAGTEVDMRRRIKYGKPAQAAWGLFSEYCNNSTVHGVKYLGERRRPWSERAWWVIVFVLSIYTCGRLIMNIWNKWDQSPVIVSFAEKSTPVWQIPFPAVTICPETKAKQTIFNFTNAYHQMHGNDNMTMTDDELESLMAVAQVCDAHLLSGLDFGYNFTEADMVGRLRSMGPDLNESLQLCKWRNTPDYCDTLFTEILTEEGFCYTFNNLDSSEMFRDEAIHDDNVYVTINLTSDHWSLEKGYTADASLNPYPVRVLGAGARAGLFILLRMFEQDLDYICRGPVQGFKILLHVPGEVPQVSKQYFRAPLNQEVIVSVRPNMITTSEGLKYYPPNRRQCYFNSERYLRYFKVYTQTNCEVECLANYTLQECGCVKFSMPRAEGIPICGAAKIECFNNAEDKLLGKEFSEGLHDSVVENVRGQTQCNCLPACTSINYDAEISQADFDWENLYHAYRIPLNETPGIQLARLSIFFKENQFITSKRSELYGPTDFLANCGGLLGLFMGVSILSIVEILYFCTIRLACNLNMRRRRKAKLVHQNNPGILVVKPGDLTEKNIKMN